MVQQQQQQQLRRGGLDVRKMMVVGNKVEPSIKPRKQQKQQQQLQQQLQQPQQYQQEMLEQHLNAFLQQQQFPEESSYNYYGYDQQPQYSNMNMPLPYGYPLQMPTLSRVDPVELIKLQDLRDSGFITEAEYAERVQQLEEAGQALGGFGRVADLTLDNFAVPYFPSDEASYAADGEALILDDFVSSFLLPAQYGSSITPEDFISSELKYQFPPLLR